MAITFITGNHRKHEEAEALLGMSLVQQKLDLPELQDLDAHRVMKAKLEKAKECGILPAIVEDSSLTLHCLNGTLPGPFIKWFEEGIGVEGIQALVAKHDDARAISSTIVGYLDEEGDTHIFDGAILGTIVPARGELDFGYGPIFMPEGSAKTFGEMTREEKHAISSRSIAFRKLKEHLEKAK